MTAEMVLGTLPWRRMDRPHAEACKVSSEKELIAQLPVEFHVFVKHLKKLNYNHRPVQFIRHEQRHQMRSLKSTRAISTLEWGSPILKTRHHNLGIAARKSLFAELCNLKNVLGRSGQ